MLAERVYDLPKTTLQSAPRDANIWRTSSQSKSFGSWSMVKRILLPIITAIAISGCVAFAPQSRSGEAATLIISSALPSNPLAIAYFVSVNGRPVSHNNSFRLSVGPGRQTIAYYCALYTDAPPPATVTMYFKPNHTYVFKCTLKGVYARVEETDDVPATHSSDRAAGH